MDFTEDTFEDSLEPASARVIKNTDKPIKCSTELKYNM